MAPAPNDRNGIPLEILREANAAPETRGRARRDAYREPITCDGEVVGFYSPHETAWGWRLGPVYVRPEYRRRGLALAAYNKFRDRAVVVFVADTNAASLAFVTRAGFVRWKPGNGGWFMRREPMP